MRSSYHGALRGAATKVTATRRVSVVKGIKQEKKEKE